MFWQKCLIFSDFRCFINGVEIVVFAGASFEIQTCLAHGFDTKKSENNHFFLDTFLSIFDTFLTF